MSYEFFCQLCDQCDSFDDFVKLVERAGYTMKDVDDPIDSIVGE